VTEASRPTSRAGTNRTSRYILIGLVLLSLALLALVVYPFASALLFAAVLAGAFHPWMERLSTRWGGRRQTTAVVLSTAVALLLVLPVAALTVSVGRQVVEGVGYVRDTLRTGGLPALVAKVPAPMRSTAEKALSHLLPEGQGEQEIEELAAAQTTRATAAVGGIIKTTSNILLQVALMLVAFFLLLVDGPQLVGWLAEVVPLKPGQTREILRDFRNTSVAVLVSSVATAGVQTVVAVIGYLLFGVPQPVFFAAVTFVVAFIPAVGATVVALLCALLLLMTGHAPQALGLALWGAILVGFSDNIVKPMLMRGRMEVHGGLIFFALLGGMTTFGPVGLVAGPLILSFFLAVVRMCRHDSAAPA
jgi:predicted PurR-regulated permease PerM